MAGHFIAMQRLLRVRRVLVAVIASPAYPDDSAGKIRTMRQIIKVEKLWHAMYVLVRAVIPAL
jgi:hypothetical protein